MIPFASSRMFWTNAAAVALVLGKLTLHLLLSGRYDYHIDELYFIDSAKHHLAFGYVDHPPMVVWATRLCGLLFDYSLFGLRLLPALAGAATVALVVLLVRRLKGGPFAQVLAGLATVFAPVYLRISVMMTLVVFEVLFWTLAAYVAVCILDNEREERRPKLWLWLGVVVGLGLLNKHTMILWMAAFFLGLLATPARQLLRSVWPWAAAVVSFVIFLPNLVWQMQNEWATLQFIRGLHEGVLMQVPRHMFVLGQILYLNPLSLPIWAIGLYALFCDHDRRFRALGICFVTLFVFFFVRHGKPYYLAAAYTLLFSFGAVSIERRCGAWSRRLRGGVLATHAAGGVGFALLSLPILSLPNLDALLGSMFGSIVQPQALTDNFHDQYGWREPVHAVVPIYRSLPPADQQAAAIVVGTYGQAGGVNLLGPDLGLPRAVSGHMTYHMWGPDSSHPAPIIAYGLDDGSLHALCRSPIQQDTAGHPLSFDREIPIYLCKNPRPLEEVWPELKRFSHVMAASFIEPE